MAWSIQLASCAVYLKGKQHLKIPGPSKRREVPICSADVAVSDKLRRLLVASTGAPEVAGAEERADGVELDRFESRQLRQLIGVD